jgi:hypothetical protein
VVPFESHLNDARQEQARQEQARQKQESDIPDYRGRILREPEPAPRKSRFPLARIFGMIALVTLTQLIVR